MNAQPPHGGDRGAELVTGEDQSEYTSVPIDESRNMWPWVRIPRRPSYIAAEREATRRRRAIRERQVARDARMTAIAVELLEQRGSTAGLTYDDGLPG